ncbi:MAG TPA: response regulator transcription factor [Pirellulales bacterium]|nr:response regulator transcription factor [Pirellulales bacterium]
MLRVLLVEDDLQIADFVVRGLREEGLWVDHARDGNTGWEALARGSWDVVLLDWWLPGIDGLTLLTRLRQTGDASPVLFLTARDAVSDRVIGLEAGADDYLCKPFAFTELLARVHALGRRRPACVSPVLRAHGVELDLAAQRARRGGQALELTAKEQALLAMFLQHPEQVLSRTRLYEQVWQERYDGMSNTLEVHVMELRRKLEAHGPRVIHTARGRGYWFGQTAQRSGATVP